MHVVSDGKEMMKTDRMLPSEITTVLISNFPDDTKDRELENLVRFMPQYEGCSRLNRQGSEKGPFGFARFSTQ